MATIFQRHEPYRTSKDGRLTINSSNDELLTRWAPCSVRVCAADHTPPPYVTLELFAYAGSFPSGSRGSPGTNDLSSSGHRRFHAANMLDVSVSVGDSVSSASGGGGGRRGRRGRAAGAGSSAEVPRETSSVNSRPVRRGAGGEGAGILSAYALSTFSANGGSSDRAGGAAVGGGTMGGSASGGRGSTPPQLHHHYQHQHQQLHHQHNFSSPQPLSPVVRAGAPPGSILSSFASPGTASWRYDTFLPCCKIL